MGQGQLRTGRPRSLYVASSSVSKDSPPNLLHLAGDSRAPHYNVAPTGDMARFVVYTAYAPVSTATKEDLIQKKWLFENTKGHSHWPQGFQPFVEQFIAPKRNGELDPHNNWTPRQKPVLSERAFKLTGIPYLEAMS